MLLDGPAIALDLGIDPALIRQWASRGLLDRRGVDRVGRVLYDYDDVLDLATRRGLLEIEA